MPAEHVVLEDEKVKRRLGDAVFTSRMSFEPISRPPPPPRRRGNKSLTKKKIDQFPNIFSPPEKAKVVDVLNDVLPRIKAFVESKVEDGLAPRAHSGPDGLYGLGGAGGAGGAGGELVVVNGHVHVG